MSNFTIDVRKICEMNCENPDATIEEIICSSMDSIFYKPSPILEDFREALQKQILLHFYTREIGFETVELWKLKLHQRLVDIMPLYNELYKTTLFDFDPLEEINYTKKYNLTANSHYQDDKNTNDTENQTQKITENNINETINNKDSNENVEGNYTEDLKESQTPQGSLDNIKQGRYLTNYDYNTKNDDKTTITHVSENNRNEDNNTQNLTNDKTNIIRDILEHNGVNTDVYSEQNRGKNSSKSYSQLVLEFRETIININMLVIEELEDLFMLIWE